MAYSFHSEYIESVNEEWFMFWMNIEMLSLIFTGNIFQDLLHPSYKTWIYHVASKICPQWITLPYVVVNIFVWLKNLWKKQAIFVLMCTKISLDGFHVFWTYQNQHIIYYSYRTRMHKLMKSTPTYSSHIDCYGPPV